MLKFDFVFTALLLHRLRPDPAGLADDAPEDAGDALLPERSLVLRTHARQNLALSPAVIGRQPGSNLDGAKFASDPSPLAEQPQQLGGQQVGFPPPVFQCFAPQ